MTEPQRRHDYRVQFALSTLVLLVLIAGTFLGIQMKSSWSVPEALVGILMLLTAGIAIAAAANYFVDRYRAAARDREANPRRQFYLSELLGALLFASVLCAVELKRFDGDAAAATTIVMLSLMIGGAAFSFLSRLSFNRWVVLSCCLLFGSVAGHTVAVVALFTTRGALLAAGGEITSEVEPSFQKFYSNAYNEIDRFLVAYGFTLSEVSNEKRVYRGSYENSPPFDVIVTLQNTQLHSGLTVNVSYHVHGFKTTVDAGVERINRFVLELGVWWAGYAFDRPIRDRQK